MSEFAVVFSKSNLEEDGILKMSYSDASTWCKTNIITPAKTQNICIGYAGTGGGVNVLDYFYRSGSSSVFAFSDWEYHRYASIQYCIDNNAADSLNVKDDFSIDTPFVSSIFAKSLCNAAFNKIGKLREKGSFNYTEPKEVNDDIVHEVKNDFHNTIAISCTADIGGRKTDDPTLNSDMFPRFVVHVKTNIEGPTVERSFAYVMTDDNYIYAREKVNTITANAILYILSGIINKSINVPKKSGSFSYRKIIEQSQDMGFKLLEYDLMTEGVNASLTSSSLGGSKKLSRKKRRNRKRSSASRK